MQLTNYLSTIFLMSRATKINSSRNFPGSLYTLTLPKLINNISIIQGLLKWKAKPLFLEELVCPLSLKHEYIKPFYYSKLIQNLFGFSLTEDSSFIFRYYLIKFIGVLFDVCFRFGPYSRCSVSNKYLYVCCVVTINSSIFTNIK